MSPPSLPPSLSPSPGSPWLAQPPTKPSAGRQAGTEASGGLVYDVKIENFDISFGNRYMYAHTCMLMESFPVYNHQNGFRDCNSIIVGVSSCSSIA